MPRIDFPRSTPLVARGGSAFTPRPVKTVRNDFPPSRALGRKISLNNLGAAYAAVAAEQLFDLEADDETMEELEDFDVDDSNTSYGSGGSFPGLARLGAPVEHNTPTLSKLEGAIDLSSTTESAAELALPEQDDEDEDEDDVDFELDEEDVELELDMCVS